jgi:RNA polymerase sigma-70 factor, ECF subfamily
MEHSEATVTQLLQEWQDGQRDAFDRLMPVVYRELRLMASRHLAREPRTGLLQTTALVHEAYMKLVDQRRVDWQGRAHFFAIAARVMRRIVIDDARHRGRDKRGGGAVHVAIDDAGELTSTAGHQLDAVDILGLDRALTRLEELDPDQARIVELRFFGGLTVDETADVMNVSPATVKRDWATAKIWLHHALTGGGPSATPL